MERGSRTESGTAARISKGRIQRPGKNNGQKKALKMRARKHCPAQEKKKTKAYQIFQTGAGNGKRGQGKKGEMPLKNARKA